MRIFYAADHEPFPGNNLWHTNLYLPLVDLGHDVVSFDYDLTPHFLNADPSVPAQAAFIQQRRGQLEEALLRQVHAAHRAKPLDVFFSYFYSAHCRPEIIREIGAMGIRTINWYCNGSYQFHLVQEIAPAFDYCLVPERFRLDDYRRIGANPIYCQEAANPNFYRPYELSKDYAVTFVGQRYGDRPEYVRHLLDDGIDIRVWGVGWQPKPRLRQSQIQRAVRMLTTRNGWRTGLHYIGQRLRPNSNSVSIELPQEITGPPLSDTEAVQLYSRSKISLGFSSCGETHQRERVLQIRLRDFEAPMSGAFYMVEYMEELEEFFEIGREIVCYRDKYDLADRVKYYLAHDAERERIRQAGHQRALRDHTWHQRFRDVFCAIGVAE